MMTFETLWKTLIVLWVIFVTLASLGMWEQGYHENKIEKECVLTYHNNRIYIDNVKIEYTLKQVSEGVYVIRKWE